MVNYRTVIDTSTVSFHLESITKNVPVVYMGRDELILMWATSISRAIWAQKSQDFQGPPLLMARVMDLPATKSCSPSAIEKNRYIGNFTSNVSYSLVDTVLTINRAQHRYVVPVQYGYRYLRRRLLGSQVQILAKIIKNPLLGTGTCYRYLLVRYQSITISTLNFTELILLTCG